MSSGILAVILNSFEIDFLNVKKKLDYSFVHLID